MSNEKQEIMADIVADIRERAENAMRNGERLVHNEAVANMLTFVADRLDAARKRDEERAVKHATRHAEAVARDNCRDCVHNPRGKNYEGGNAAAMREALNDVLEKIDRWRTDGVIEHWQYSQLFDIADAALAEPPRNCDLEECSTVDGMISAHEMFCKSWHDAGNYCSECPYNSKSQQMITCREMWLLAPAKKSGAE